MLNRSAKSMSLLATVTVAVAALSMVPAVAVSEGLSTDLGYASSRPGAARPSAACVSGAGCYRTLRAALSAAGPGDRIRLSAGVFKGGVRIHDSVRVVGAGRGKTIIRGGGPVLRVASREHRKPEVAISALTVTGGVTHGDGINAFGGGILVSPPKGSGGGSGASLRLTRVAVVRNRTVSTDTSPSPSGVTCPQGDCPYAGSFGGGIATYGSVRLNRSRVAHNWATGLASDAIGGGIWSANGDLKITRSAVHHNHASPRRIGRYAEGGGIFVQSGSLSLRHSAVNHNRADLVTSWPVTGQGELIDMSANSGGVHAGDNVDTVITDSRINHNTVRAIDPAGEPLAFSAAILVRSRLTMRHATVAHNALVTRVATTEDIAPVGAAFEVDAAARIRDARIIDNTVLVHTADGPAIASSGLAVYDFTDAAEAALVGLRNVLVARNSAHAISDTGTASVLGAGIFNNTRLKLISSAIRNNIGSARGAASEAQGGGIWNGEYLSGPPVELTLENSRVVGNNLQVGPAGTAQGGGVFNAALITYQRSRIARNQPDQCYGCTITTDREARSHPGTGLAGARSRALRGN